MTADPKSRFPRRFLRWGPARYVLLWLLGGALVAVIVTSVVDRLSPEQVTLPPVRETALPDAARRAGCDLRRTKPGEVTRPPVDGAASVDAARPGIYDRPPSADELVAALRGGIIVIHHRQDVPPDLRGQLEKLQKAVPGGTIVTPDSSGMPYEVAATAYRRLLGCHRVDATAFDALRLFHGRFIGAGASGGR